MGQHKNKWAYLGWADPSCTVGRETTTDRMENRCTATGTGIFSEQSRAEETGMAMPTFHLAPDLPPVSRLCFGSSSNTPLSSLPGGPCGMTPACARA